MVDDAITTSTDRSSFFETFNLDSDYRDCPFFWGRKLLRVPYCSSRSWTYGYSTVFSFITLPVEYDASRRALAWLTRERMLTDQEYDGAQDALKWAARTYLVAALGALASLLYWAMQVMRSRD